MNPGQPDVILCGKTVFWLHATTQYNTFYPAHGDIRLYFNANGTMN